MLLYRDISDYTEGNAPADSAASASIISPTRIIISMHEFSPAFLARLSALVILIFGFQGTTVAETEVTKWHGYEKAVQISNGDCRVVLAPEVGGRIVEYSLNDTNILYVSDQEKNWRPGMKSVSSAGRFDIGPELVIPRRNILWNGEWTAEITGPLSVQLTSQPDESTGVQLERTFVLAKSGTWLQCTQTIRNVSQQTRQWCHWSRTFAVGKGIVIIPLNPVDQIPQSRFPNQYVMYEQSALINMKPEDPAIRKAGNNLEIHPTPAKPKLGFDSYAGTIAYQAPNDLLFVKRFDTYPDRVYNEAAGLTISVWYPDREMVELEPIGPREIITPGKAASFTEHWFLEEMAFPEDGKTVDYKQLNSALGRLKK